MQIVQKTSHEAQKKGFTLIELLVVIAIIALLAAILFPVFARARENARRASCQSNLKQIGLGVMQYVQDYDERYPAQWIDANNSSTFNNGDKGWVQIVQPYVKSQQIFQCPSETTSPDPNLNFETSNATNANFNWTDYAYNNMIGATTITINDTLVTGLSASALTYPANTIIVSENGGSTNARLNERGGNGTPDDRLNGTASVATHVQRHLEGANYAFADGHVKWLRPTAISGWNVAPTGSNYTFDIN